MIALKLKNITVQHANMLPALNIVSFPAITAFTGFGDALAFNYGLNTSSVTIISQGCDVEYGFKNYGTYNTNKIKGVNTYTSAKSKKDMALSAQPNVFGILLLTLYVFLEDSALDKISKDKENGKLKKDLLTKYRVAGGVIKNIDEISILTEESLFEEDIRKNKIGYFVVDKRDLIDNRDESQNQIEKAFEYINARDPDKGISYSLTAVGYYLLEEPTQREGSRNNKEHAYAEPLVGLISFESVAKFDRESPLPIWEMVWQDNVVVAIN